MRLTFNQVSGPNFSGVSQALAAGNRSISNGIASIGNTVTNLGKRREARAAVAKQEAEAQALESFKLGAVNADAQALSQLAQGAAPGGQLPVGAADFIAQRQRSLLDNDSVRASTEDRRATTDGRRAATADTIEGTRGKTLLNDGTEIELNNTRAANGFQKEYAADIVAANNLANQGRGDEAQAVLDRVLGSAGPKYGADIVLSTIDAVNNRTTAGDDARTGVANNATSVLQGRANLRNTNISNQGSILNNNAQAQANRVSEHNFNNQIAGEQEKNAINDAIARAVNGTTGVDDSLINIQTNPNLSPQERLRAAAGVRETLSAPDALNTFSPIDPLNQNILDIAESNPAEGQADFSAVADFVEGAARSELSRSSSQQIFRESKEISPDVEHINIEQTLKERYPNQKFGDEIINQIDSIIDNTGINKREAIAIVDKAIGKRGNFGGFLGVGKPLANLISPKNRNDREFSRKKFDDIVETYVQEVSQGNLQKDRGQRQRDIDSANSLEGKYQNAVAARTRAVQSGNQQLVARYDQILSNLNTQAKSLEKGALDLEDLNRSQAQTTFERIFDPNRHTEGLLSFKDLIGISDKDRELRTRRRLNRGK